MIALRAAPLLAMLAAGPAAAQALTPQEVFRRVAPSVVVVEVEDVPKTGKARLIASGSGVIIPDRSKDGVKDGILVATNCHVVDQSSTGLVGIQQGDDYGFGVIANRDAERDLCLVRGFVLDDPDSSDTFKAKKLPAVQVGSSQWLEVGDTVYAVGAPQGLELSLSNGLVSGFRQHKGSEYIQTTAPISKGSSGGGLFDAQGRLVGITTMYVKDGQALNFAVPAELIASVPRTESREIQRAAYEPKPAPPPQRDRWIWVAKSSGGSNFYIDTQTVQRDGANVTVWEKHILPKPKTDESGDTYDETLSLNTYHCTSRQYTSKVFSQSLRGSRVYTSEIPSYRQQRNSVAPETVGEAILEAACEL